MRSLLLALLVILGLAAGERPTHAAGVQRFAIVAAANDGGPGRPQLRYAVSDAHRFAAVLQELGGVRAADAVLLEEPGRADLESAIEQLRARVIAATPGSADAAPERSEILFYYSGHADESGLRLGNEHYPYRTLRDRLDSVPADVRIAVLDACASGAFTRLKGGRLQQPFLVDESAAMRGHVYLTSSAETEVAQESDQIQASYFTHFLISGLRGAADANGEGKVTLNEAYQFAYDETLGRTVDTQGGAQHPSYDINLSGAGDVVITDLRETSAGLVLGASTEGRFFVRNAGQKLVVELYKPAGRRVELGLEPGAYEIRLEREDAASLARARIASDTRTVLEESEFTPVDRSATRFRGRRSLPAHAVSGRNRLGLRFGTWRVSERAPDEAFAGVRLTNLCAGIQYCRFLSERTAVSLGSSNLSGDVGATVSVHGVSAGSRNVTALFLGLQWNPMRRDVAAQSVRPYLTLGMGPVIGSASGAFLDGGVVRAGDDAQVTVGAQAGAGVDVLLGRRWSMGFGTGYNWVDEFARPVGERRDFSGIEMTLSLGWLFGSGHAAGRSS